MALIKSGNGISNSGGRAVTGGLVTGSGVTQQKQLVPRTTSNIVVEDVTNPLVPLSPQETESLLERARDFDAVVGGNTVSMALQDRMSGLTRTILNDLKEARTGLTSLYQAHEDIEVEISSVIQTMPNRKQNFFRRIVNSIDNLIRSRRPIAVDMDAVLKEIYPGLAARYPNPLKTREGIAHLLDECAEAAAKSEKAHHSALALLFEIPAFIPIANLLVKVVAHLPMLAPAVTLTITLLSAVLLARLSHMAVKELLGWIITMWRPVPKELQKVQFSDHGSAGLRTFITLGGLVVVVLALAAWLVQDYVYLASSIARSNMEVPSGMVIFVAAFGVALATGSMLVGALSHVQSKQATLVATLRKRGVVGAMAQQIAILPETAQAAAQVQMRYVQLHTLAVMEFEMFREISRGLAIKAPSKSAVAEIVERLGS